MEQHSLITELILIFASSVLVAGLFHRARVPTIVCYLLVGAILGPGLGWVTSVDHFQVIAEFGVAFLLFTLGLEFSIPKLKALRRVVFGLGSLQVLVSVALFGGVIYLTRDIYHLSITATLIAASVIALSSTAIVTKELAQRNEVASAHGSQAIGILLFQDIAAIVLLVLISVGDVAGADVALAMTTALAKVLLFALVMFAIGKWLLPTLLAEISKTKSEELFVLCVLVVALGAAAGAHALDLSMALGAFMAGMMLGESHFRHQIEAEIRPFRDVLLGIFFVSVGLVVDLDLVLTYWPRILFFTFCLMAFKTLLIAGLCRVFGSDNGVALRTGLILSQGGEFGFALLALAVAGNQIPQDVASFFIAIIVLSMALTPFVIANSRKLAQDLLRKTPVEAVALPEKPASGHVLLCGYGRVGQIIARFLRQEGVPFVAVDDDPALVERARTLGDEVVFGNARKINLLQHLGLAQAALVVISFDDPAGAKEILHQIRRERPHLPILVRTRDDAELVALQQAGATEVIPEILEASLMLVSHVMAALGLPASKVFATMRQVRQDRYSLLHGYILGNSGYSEYLNQLQPVFLPKGAWVVGRTLADCKLERFGIAVHSLRRGARILAKPAPDMVFEAEDIVVLAGEESGLERAESVLLGGG